MFQHVVRYSDILCVAQLLHSSFPHGFTMYIRRNCVKVNILNVNGGALEPPAMYSLP